MGDGETPRGSRLTYPIATHPSPFPLKHVTIYTDGACSGNPGPGGWAAVLRYEDGRGGIRERVLTGHAAETTNNRMELTAIVEALAALTEPVAASVHTDSAYVASAFNEGWLAGWRRRGWTTADRKPVKNRDLWERLLPLTARHAVRFVKVRGHADDALNNRVDRLAVAALNAGRAEAA
jgi:ribonuclease HI